MRNRSKAPSDALPVHYFPVAYQDDFPACAYRYRQTDRPIVCLHHHQSPELGLCLSGSGIFMAGQKVFAYRAGDVCAISPCEPHLARSAPGTASDWIFLNFDVAELGAGLLETRYLNTAALSGASFRNVFSGREHPALAEGVRRFEEELREKRPGYQPLLRALAVQMLVLLQRLPGRSRAKRPAVAGGELERIAPALNYIGSHYGGMIEIPALAVECHLSLPHFRRLFTRQTGCSPQEYLIRWRVRMASVLLETTAQSVTTIANLCGFGSLSAFNRHFMRLLNRTPRSYRQDASKEV